MSSLSEISYWSQNHPKYEIYNKLFEELVPDNGMCDTVEGELIRAISKITYDFYNNGFGNNWSGALEYLEKYLPNQTIDETSSRHRLEMFNHLDFYSQGRVVSLNAYTESILIELVDMVVDYVLSKNTHYTTNSVDMLNLGKENFYDEDDEDYEEYEDYEDYEDDEDYEDYEDDEDDEDNEDCEDK